MKEAHHKYSEGNALWTCQIISTEEDVQPRTTKTAQGVVGGCIYLGKMIFCRESLPLPRFLPAVVESRSC